MHPYRQLQIKIALGGPSHLTWCRKSKQPDCLPPAAEIALSDFILKFNNITRLNLNLCDASGWGLVFRIFHGILACFHRLSHLSLSVETKMDLKDRDIQECNELLDKPYQTRLEVLDLKLRMAVISKFHGYVFANGFCAILGDNSSFIQKLHFGWEVPRLRQPSEPGNNNGDDDDEDDVYEDYEDNEDDDEMVVATENLLGSQVECLWNTPILTTLSLDWRASIGLHLDMFPDQSLASVTSLYLNCPKLSDLRYLPQVTGHVTPTMYDCPR